MSELNVKKFKEELYGLIAEQEAEEQRLEMEREERAAQENHEMEMHYRNHPHG